MRRARWVIKPSLESLRPVIYHCVSRVVNREFVFGSAEKEQLRKFMRMYEVFSGNRILAYCFMSNHIHLLLEIVPAATDGLSDEELLWRLRAIHTEAEVAEVAEEIREARKTVAKGLADGSRVRAIHERFTYRMHDLSQFMKGFMQRYTQWHKDNGTVLPDLGLAAMLRHHVRYFTDGAVIGSKAFVNEAFAVARERFGARRRDGARKMRGSGAPAAGLLWSVRDLRMEV